LADHSLAMRRAVVQHLLQGSVSGMVGGRIYGEEAPENSELPFIRYGLPVTTPYESSCGRGSQHSIVVHVFAQGPYTDLVASIASAVVSSLDDSSLPVDPLRLLGISWTGTRIIRDTAEMSSYHAIVSLTAQTIGD